MQDEINFDRLIISGDFNYSLARTQILHQATSKWINLLELFFYNAIQMNDLMQIPTFQRTCRNSIVSSVIDYIYLGQNLQHQLRDTQITCLHSEWPDHSILHISFLLDSPPTGPGIWRVNPMYASHPMLQDKLTEKITDMM